MHTSTPCIPVALSSLLGTYTCPIHVLQCVLFPSFDYFLELMNVVAMPSLQEVATSLHRKCSERSSYLSRLWTKLCPRQGEETVGEQSPKASSTSVELLLPRGVRARGMNCNLREAVGELFNFIETLPQSDQ